MKKLSHHIPFARLLFAAGLLACASVPAQGPTPKFVDATGADNFKLLFIAKAKSPPTIDGKLDDACWKDAEVISDFGHCEYGSRNCPFPRTEARYLWDDRYLYVAFTCYEDAPENMARHNKAVEDKSRDIYGRDCVELHVNGNNDNATRFQVWFIDTLEKMIFWHYDFGWGILVNENYGLSADWDYASSRGPNYWQIEGRIALADIQIQPRVGYIFGMNPCRFRFGMNGASDDGKKYGNGEISHFLTWSTQGGDHHDVRLYGKCVLVEKQPASVADGLKLAFSDLDQRTIMVQTGSGFDTFDHGKQSKLGYLDKLREELAATQAVAKKLQDVLALQAPPSVNTKPYAEWAKPHFEKLEALAKDIGGRNQVTVGELNAKRKELGEVQQQIENVYWDAQRALLLAEGTARVTVDLKPIVEVPVGRDEPENTPDPRTRQVPHVPWAKNFIGGKTAALIITPEGASWDAYELQQRMDLDAEVYYLTGNFGASIGPATDYYKEGILLFPQKKAQLQRLLARNHEAYVFLNCNPNALPKDLQYVIAQRLVGGAAVVVFQSQDWGLTGLADAKRENDAALRESIPSKTMTRLVTSTDWWIDHRGMGIDPLERAIGPLEVPPFSKTVVGKGRYITFSPGGVGYWYSNPLTPHYQQDPDGLFQAEYYYSLDAKILLDAVGKLSPRRLLSVNCGAAPLAPGTKNSASASTRGTAFSGKLRIVTRDQWGRVTSDVQQDVKLPEGKSEIPLALPALAAGDYYVDASLLQGDKIVDWASQRFRVRGKVVIKSLQIANRSPKESDRLKASVEVDQAAPSSTLRAEIRDVDGRVLQRLAGIKLQGGRAQIELPLRGAWHTYHRLDVFVEDGGVVQDRRFQSFYVDHAEHDDFTVFTDGDGLGRYGSLRRHILREFGVSLFENQGNPEDNLGAGGELATRYWLSGSSNETGGSLASDAYHKNLVETMKRVAQMYAARGARFVSTGDDSGVQPDFVETYPNWTMPLVKRFSQKYPPVPRPDDRFPSATAAFFTDRGLPNRGEYWRFLWNTTLDEIKSMKLQPGDLEVFVAAFKETYPTIAEFNRANGTSFASFEAITADDIKKINPPFVPDVMGFQDWLQKKYSSIQKLNEAWGAQEKSFETLAPGVLVPRLTGEGKYAAALDKRTYLEDLFIRHMETAGHAVHSVDRRIGIGQGAASFDNVIPEVLAHTDTYAPYLADVNFEIGRSFPHKWVGQTLGVYGGKAVKVPARIEQTWHVLFSGGNFIWFWSACTGGLMGDLTTNPSRSGAMLETIRELKQGIDSCLLRGQRQHDGIAILHSRDSGHMDGVVKEMSTQANSEGAFQRIVEDLGMQYRYISTANVENGVLGKGEFKVLLLPYTQVVTPKEAAAIEQFVKQGGAVIADLRAGTFSIEGKALNPGALDELFGITRTHPRAKSVRDTLTLTGLGDAPSTLAGVQADASIAAKSAKPYGKVGEVPVMLVNEAGKGKAILMNIGIGAYDFLLNRNELGAGREAFARLFALAGVKSRFRVTAGGKDVPGVELAVFKRDAARYLTVEKRSFEYEKYPLQAEIALDGKYEVTDMRTGKSLGNVDRILVKLEGLGCHVWSLLPYRVEAVEVKAPKSVKRGEDLKVDIRLKTSAVPATHVVRVEVTSPGGAHPFEMRKLDTKDGKATYILPVAFNDEAGAWKIQVTDVSSGVSGTGNCTVTGE